MFTATFSKMVAKVFRKGLQTLREAISPISTEIFIAFPFKITGTESNDPFGFFRPFTRPILSVGRYFRVLLKVVT